MRRDGVLDPHEPLEDQVGFSDGSDPEPEPTPDAPRDLQPAPEPTPDAPRDLRPAPADTPDPEPVPDSGPARSTTTDVGTGRTGISPYEEGDEGEDGTLGTGWGVDTSDLDPRSLEAGDLDPRGHVDTDSLDPRGHTGFVPDSDTIRDSASGVAPDVTVAHHGGEGMRTTEADIGGETVVVGTRYDPETADDAGAWGEEGISPAAEMALDDPDAIEARAEKEQEILAQREAEGVGDIPVALGAGLFAVGQDVEQTGIETGESLTEAVPSAEVGPQIGEEHVGEVPANLIGGSVSFAGMGAGAALQMPASVGYDVHTQMEGGETPTDIQGGTLETAQTFGETQWDMATEYPMSTALGFAAPTAQGVPAGVRGYRATRGTEGRVGFEDITTERGQRGDLPEFDTPTDAPTRRAIDELETRRADQPEVIQEQAGGEGVLFHTTEQPFGGRVQVGEGASEYPGLFVSPEASPLGFRTRGVSRPDDSGPTFGFGDWSLTPEQAPGFRPRSMEPIPQRAAEPGYAVRDPQGNVVETGLSRADANALADRVGGERVPDPTTRGYEFMFEEAPTETGMVRPPGDRTTEMEAIIAPESEFVATGAVAVEMPGGRLVRSDIYQPVGEPARGPGRPGRADADAPGDAPPRTAADITESARPPTRQPDVTYETLFGTATGAGAGTTGLPGATTTGTSPTPATTTRTTGTTTTSDPFGTMTEPTPTATDPTSTGTGSDPFGGPSEPTPTTWTTTRVPPTRPAPGTREPSRPAFPTDPLLVPTDRSRRPRPRTDDRFDELEPAADEPVGPATPLFENPIVDVWPPGA